MTVSAPMTPAQRAALVTLAPALEPGTYLAGGVAVALFAHHRTSLDLDLFLAHGFDADRVAERLQAAIPGLRVTSRAEGTLYLEVSGVVVSMLAFRYPTLVPPANAHELPVPVASPEDLCCMKLSAIAGRGAAKDFWDLDELLRRGVGGGTLEGALALYSRKFATEDVGHVVRALAYFGDANAAPLPRGLTSERWAEIQRTMAARVRALG